MANVLPKENRKLLRRHYWIRFVVVSTFALSVAVGIGATALVPSYVAVQTELEAAKIEQELQGQTREVTKEDGAIQEAKMVNLQVSELLKTDARSSSSAIDSVLRDWRPHANEVALSNITYTLKENIDKKKKKVIVTTMRLSGVADNREALNEFVQTLRRDPAFSDVSFPVSDLVGVEEIDFSLTMSVL